MITTAALMICASTLMARAEAPDRPGIALSTQAALIHLTGSQAA